MEREATYDEKKKFLEEYYRLKSKEEVYQLELDALDKLGQYPNNVITGLPKGKGGKKDLSDVMELLEDKREDILSARLRATKSAVRIMDVINQLDDEDEKKILMRRHVHCWSWNRICDCMNYSRSGMDKKYRKAVNEIVLKIKVKE